MECSGKNRKADVNTAPMRKIQISSDYLISILTGLLTIASPAGFTDEISSYVGKELGSLGFRVNRTRRGAIRATLPGRQHPPDHDAPDRAIVAHVDTLGAMVRSVEKRGRLSISPVGKWSSRFAEGARVTVFTETGPVRGTVLPLMSSGHIYGDAVDAQPTGWDHVEVRIDHPCETAKDAASAGIQVGDFIAFDSALEVTATGFVNARHLDDKAGAAILLAVAKSVSEGGLELPVDCHLLFTTTEEVGTGACAVVYDDVDELVVIDHAPVGPGQKAIETGVTLCMMDQSGPFDLHLTRHLIQLCNQYDIASVRDLYKHYRSDSAAAIEAGSDIRTALIGFGVDASHGYERTHLSSLMAVADLIGYYIQSPLRPVLRT
jgi:peptidase M42 family hydrolase